MTAFVIPVIQSSLVSTENISVLSREDSWSAMSHPLVTSEDLGSVLVLKNSSVMDSVISSTITARLSDKQPYLWSSDQDRLRLTSLDSDMNYSSESFKIPKGQFFATIPVGTDTGVLRYIALRLNTSVSCTTVPQSDFPSICPGASPFSQTFSNPCGDSDRLCYRARICVPGQTSSCPWKDTPDAQSISEELWLDYQGTKLSQDGLMTTDGKVNYTQHCYGNSTLGHFEIPNYWNGHVTGPLLETLPPNGPNLTYRNSESTRSDFLVLDTESTDGVAGPFLTAVMAIFGPNTFFSTATAHSNYTSSDMTLNMTLPLCA